jgi:hypothetical protein
VVQSREWDRRWDDHRMMERVGKHGWQRAKSVACALWEEWHDKGRWGRANNNETMVNDIKVREVCGRQRTGLGWCGRDRNNSGVRELRNWHGDGGAGWTTRRGENVFSRCNARVYISC